jgi:cell division protein FtsI (penicillin-binding protein 3)
MSEIKKDILSRIGLYYVGIALFVAIVLGRILYLQIIEGSFWKSKALELSQKNIIIPPMRGDILSSDGKVLATSVPYYEIHIDFRAEGLKKEVFYKNIDSLSIKLSKIFPDKTIQEYRKELVEAYKEGQRYYLLKRRIGYEEYKQLKTFPLFKLGQNKGGLIALQIYYRAKPFGMLASRTLGYTSADRVVVGIEGAFDNYLRGKEGIQFMQRLSGNIWMPIHNGNAIEPQDGYDVVTTIDVNLQDVAHHSLLSHLQANNADHGCAIVMETSTGYVKAIVNLEYDSIRQNYTEKFNYAIGESAEPGSVFKLVSMIAALDEGYVKITDSVNTGNGEVTYYGSKMKDAHEGGLGKISVADVFALSSNVGTSKIITSCFTKNPRAFVERIYNLKLNEKLGLDIKGEGVPFIKDPSDTSWSGTTLPWMSIGYEVKLTPMQILTLYNAVANNGRMIKPILIKELRYRGEVVKKFESQVINPAICSQQTLKDLKFMLNRVVEKGTAKNLSGTIYKIAGKTGTAQIARGKHGYKDENAQKTYRASFVGYFPADNPKFSCIVVVSSPSKSVYYGNVVAGPIFKEIADKIYATHVDLQQDVNQTAEVSSKEPMIKAGYSSDIFKLSRFIHINSNTIPNSSWISATYSGESVSFKPFIINHSLIPNVIGMGLRDAMHILGNCGLEVRVIGRGKVVKQSLLCGTKYQKGEIIYIELS